MCSQGTGGEPSARNASRSRDEAAAGRWWRRLKVQGGGASTTARGGTSGWCSWQSADANTERLALGARVRYHIYLDHHGFGAHRDACPRRRSACPHEDGARKMPLDDRSVSPSLPPSLPPCALKEAFWRLERARPSAPIRGCRRMSAPIEEGS